MTKWAILLFSRDLKRHELVTGLWRIPSSAGLPADCLNYIIHRPEDGAKTTTALIQASEVKKLLEDAVSKGAKTLYDDVGKVGELGLATLMKPIVIEGVKEGMDLYYTESFGPTVSLFEVRSDAEAVRIANDTDYGLASAVFTKDLRRGLKIARQIEITAVHINGMSVRDESSLQHGGAKKSGRGRFNSLAGLKEWVRTKTITWKD